MVLDGTRNGDDMVLLSSGREIARDNLWAIRALVALVFANGLVNGSPEHLGVVLGMVVVFTSLYWVALRLTSSPIDDHASGATPA